MPALLGPAVAAGPSGAGASGRLARACSPISPDDTEKTVGSVVLSVSPFTEHPGTRGVRHPRAALGITHRDGGDRITESQNHRIVGVGRDLCGSSSPIPPAEAGSPTAGCTGPCPGGSGISPEKETPQPPWAACSSAPMDDGGDAGGDGADPCACCCHRDAEDGASPKVSSSPAAALADPRVPSLAEVSGGRRQASGTGSV